MMSSFAGFISSILLHWWIVMIVCVLGVTATCVWGFESDTSRSKRVEQKKTKEVRALASKISSYAQNVHQRFPSGDVIVSERDLAEQLGKNPVVVATALNILSIERKAHRTRLKGYWKLNV